MFHFHCIRYKPTLIASDGVATETWLELEDRHWDFVKKAGSGSRRLKFSWLTQFFKNISQKKVINTFELSIMSHFTHFCHLSFFHQRYEKQRSLKHAAFMPRGVDGTFYVSRQQSQDQDLQHSKSGFIKTSLETEIKYRAPILLIFA